MIQQRSVFPRRSIAVLFFQQQLFHSGKSSDVMFINSRCSRAEKSTLTRRKCAKFKSFYNFLRYAVKITKVSFSSWKVSKYKRREIVWWSNNMLSPNCRAQYKVIQPEQDAAFSSVTSCTFIARPFVFRITRCEHLFSVICPERGIHSFHGHVDICIFINSAIKFTSLLRPKL